MPIPLSSCKDSFSRFKWYKPLKLPLVLHDIPPKIFKYIPLFNGEDDVTGENNMETFEHFTYFLDIKHEYVFMRLFT
jgi:hypothetical protein